MSNLDFLVEWVTHKITNKKAVNSKCDECGVNQTKVGCILSVQIIDLWRKIAIVTSKKVNKKDGER